MSEPVSRFALYTGDQVRAIDRHAIESLGTQVTAGGMPTRVKCLHVHVAHALAKGPGVNPMGDEALAILREQELWPAGDCAS